MKAIIPVAGAGTRLRPHTFTQPKALIPLAGKTILCFIIDQLKNGGVEEFVFIIGYLGEKIKAFVAKEYPDLKAEFVWQDDRHGTGHAILQTKEIVADDQVIIVLGDTIAEFDLQSLLSSGVSMLGVKKVDDPRQFGVVEIDDDKRIIRVVEKPLIPKSNLALVGVYKIIESDVLFDCLTKVANEKKDGIEDFSITEALQCMISRGIRFDYFKVSDWFDCGRVDPLLETNSILLKKAGGNTGPDHSYHNTIIIPPVSIGPGCMIRNSIVGPHISIGENTTVENCILKDSIIGSYSNIRDIYLKHSFIGSDAELHGVSRSLSIGDNTAINLGGLPQ